MKTFIFFVLGITVLTSNCKRTSNTQWYHDEIVWDVTDTFNIQAPEVILEKISEAWELEQNQVTLDKITVNITSIDQVSRPKLRPHELDYAGSWLERNDHERLDDQEKFLKDVHVNLKLFTWPRPEKRYSYVYRNINSSIHRLSVSDADHKRLIIFGDMLQNNPRTVSFYRCCKKTPKVLSDQVMIDSLSQMLLADQNMPALKGVEILIVGVADETYDELHLQSIEFWTAFFSRAGASDISFIPNL